MATVNAVATSEIPDASVDAALFLYRIMEASLQWFLVYHRLVSVLSQAGQYECPYRHRVVESDPIPSIGTAQGA